MSPCIQNGRNSEEELFNITNGEGLKLKLSLDLIIIGYKNVLLLFFITL